MDGEKGGTATARERARDTFLVTISDCVISKPGTAGAANDEKAVQRLPASVHVPPYSCLNIGGHTLYLPTLAAISGRLQSNTF